MAFRYFAGVARIQKKGKRGLQFDLHVPSLVTRTGIEAKTKMAPIQVPSKKWLRRESNLDLELRKLLYYPLYYEANCGAKVMFRTEKRGTK